MPRPFRKLICLWQDRSGIAAVEIAMCLPFLAILLLGAVEITRYVLVAQKLEKVAVTLSDVATQSETITTAQLDLIIPAAAQVMQPYSFGTNAYVIISSVTLNSGSTVPVVNWQYKGGGTWTQASRIGSTGTAATLPAGFTLDSQENVIISEVFYNFQPMFGTNILPSNFTIYKTGFFRPRLGSLTTLSLFMPALKGPVLKGGMS